MRLRRRSKLIEEDDERVHGAETDARIMRRRCQQGTDAYESALRREGYQIRNPATMADLTKGKEAR